MLVSLRAAAYAILPPCAIFSVPVAPLTTLLSRLVITYWHVFSWHVARDVSRRNVILDSTIQEVAKYRSRVDDDVLLVAGTRYEY